MIYKNSIYRGVILILSLLVALHICISVFKIVSTTAPDFSGFYNATQIFLHHQNPYSVNGIRLIIIPPPAAIIFVLFTLIPYKISQGIFVILSALSVPIIVWLSLKIVFKKYTIYTFLLFTSLTYLSFPIKFTLGMGQVNLLALLLLLTGYLLYEKKILFKSGVVVALAIVVKPVLIYILFFFLFKKAWKTILAIILTGILSILVSTLLFGLPVEFYYITEVFPHLIKSITNREVYYNQGLQGFISRLSGSFFIRRYTTQLLSLLLVIFSFIYSSKRKFNDNLVFSIFLSIVLIIHTLAWQHQFVFLIFPFIYSAYIVVKNRDFVAGVLLFISYVLVSWNIKNPVTFNHFPESLLLSHTFYGTLILIMLLFKSDIALKK